MRIAGLLLLSLFVLGCGDKKTTRYITQVLEPPVECGKHECKHSIGCVPCNENNPPEDP